MAVFYEQNRVYVPLGRIAPTLRQAVIAIEDARFFEHGGVDLRGTLRAVVTNARAGDIEQGGSSLTQQYVKNVLIEAAGEDRGAVEAARAQNVSRKIQELRYAIALEEKLSKQQILERYLNISYFGGSAYGAEAAARRYFSIPASKLNLQQAALLAGTIQKPVAYDPLRNPEAATARRNTVLDRMAQVGYISPEQAAQAKQTRLDLAPSEPTNGCITSANAAFFCDYVLNVIKNDPIFGKTKGDRVKLLLRGGLTIRTTLDVQAQKAATRAVRKAVEPNNRVASAIAMVEPGTGDIKAMAVNRAFGEGRGKTKINYATDFAYGGSGGFQAGSTFKPFVLATAIQQGIPLTTRFNASSTYTATKFKPCDGGRFLDEWSPSNYGGNSYGSIDMRTATWRSVNTYYAQLEERTGVCKPPALAEKMGVIRADGAPLLRDRSFVLGADEVSPLRMAEGYATFAARGIHCEARAITAVVDRTGKGLRVPPRDCERAMETGVADVVNWVLKDVIDGPDPNRTGVAVSLGRPAAGKTGTTNGTVAVWFCGYTPNLAAAVWVGDPRGNKSKYALTDVRIRGQTYGQLTGGRFAGPIWKEAMQGALKGVKERGFAQPGAKYLRGNEVTVPQLRGFRLSRAIAALEGLGLAVAVQDQRVPSQQPRGSVALTSPPGGAQAFAGDTVKIFLSTDSGLSPIFGLEPPVTFSTNGNRRRDHGGGR
jgi:membrane peptidoglycan carboxypeptidase